MIFREQFENLRLGPLRGLKRCDLLKLGRINVLCGKNNTGKSTLLEAASNKATRANGLTPSDDFVADLVKANNDHLDRQHGHFARGRHLRHLLPDLFREVIQARMAWFAGEEKELVELINKKVAGPNHAELRQAIHSTAIVQDLESSFTYPTVEAIYIPPIRRIEVSGKIATAEEPQPEGKGVVNRLFHLRNQPPGSDGLKLAASIDNSFKEITDGFRFGVFSEKENNYALKFSTDEKTWIPAEHCGKGLQDLLVILYFALSKTRGLLLIEEPEVHLHPEMQRRLLAHLRSNTESQYIFSTHSNVFLDGALTDRVFLTRFDAEVLVSDATSKTTFLHDLGYSPVDNLVSDLIILVEGPSDVPVIEEFLKKRGLYETYSIKLWPLGGDIMAKAEIDLTVFAQSHHVLALVDGDPGSGKVRKRFQTKCSDLNIECARLKRYSIENYFSLRALRQVFGSQIPDAITEILGNEKLESQIGINVKSNNRSIAREMNLEEIAGTDLGKFFDRVEQVLRGV
ncbi:MAG TPA: AAA family ATPase [Pyrinomonadaceae bacterium]|jgi:predicted ATPase|nr:AAA family ATPase [Pyrinomonadaceae bacterium]